MNIRNSVYLIKREKVMYLIGIDVGGTHTKFGLIKDGTLLKSLKVSTNTFDVIRQIGNGARELAQNAGISFDDVSGIAVGFPGMVIDNVVKESPNLGLQNCNIVELLEQELDGKNIIAMNDAELAVLAEHKMGAGQGCENMVLITIGTGVGGGVIIDKQLYVGKGGAGELGHITLERDGRECRCGRRGCAEQYISLTALDRMVRELHPSFPDTSIVLPIDSKVDGSDLVKAYKRNDALAMVVVDKYVKLLKDYILNLCNLLRPDKVVIGGGLCYAPEIIEMVAKACKEDSYGFANSPSVAIVSAELGNDAGILGASVVFDGVDLNPQPEYDLNRINSALNDIYIREDISADQADVEVQSGQYDYVEDEPQENNANNSNNLLDALYSSSQSEEVVEYNQNMLDSLNDKLNRNN